MLPCKRRRILAMLSICQEGNYKVEAEDTVRIMGIMQSEKRQDDKKRNEFVAINETRTSYKRITEIKLREWRGQLNVPLVIG